MAGAGMTVYILYTQAPPKSRLLGCTGTFILQLQLYKSRLQPTADVHMLRVQRTSYSQLYSKVLRVQRTVTVSHVTPRLCSQLRCS